MYNLNANEASGTLQTIPSELTGIVTPEIVTSLATPIMRQLWYSTSDIVTFKKKSNLSSNRNKSKLMRAAQSFL